MAPAVMVSSDSKLAYALAYARQGHRVVPVHGIDRNGCCECGNVCSSPGKHPCIADWPSQATNDESQIQAWWSHRENSNIGLKTGVDYDVHDIDRPGALEEFEAHFGPLPKTLVARTAGGGLHLYVKRTPGLKSRTNVLKKFNIPGVGIRAENGRQS